MFIKRLILIEPQRQILIRIVESKSEILDFDEVQVRKDLIEQIPAASRRRSQENDFSVVEEMHFVRDLLRVSLETTHRRVCGGDGGGRQGV